MTEPTDAGPSPCPFCGSPNVVHYEVEGRDNHHFECCECLAASMCKTTRKEALAAWNRRTPQPTQPQAGAVPMTPERIMELSDRLLRVVGAGYVRPQDAEGFARAIEAEVRKEYTELIQQLVEALETCDEGDGYNGPYQYHSEIAVESAITAGRARLEGKQ